MTLKIAMVGGGPGAFIGEIHRHALSLDGHFELVAGCFSSDPSRGRQAGERLGIDPARCYSSWQELLSSEAPRVDAVTIVTPNDTHFPISVESVRAGLAVMCEKPATISLQQAMSLRDELTTSSSTYGLALTYLGYPMVTEARQRVLDGQLGAVRRIDVRYVQGWLSTPLEQSGNKQASWRTDPARSGKGGALGDIGTHAFSLAEYVGAQSVSSLCSQVNTLVGGRRLDDDASALLKFSGGAVGTLVCSQICAGEHNGLTISVYGESGYLKWAQEAPNTLILGSSDGSERRLYAGSNSRYLNDCAAQFTRTPSGHPEGYIEAFANLYSRFSQRIAGNDVWLPGIDEGVRGLAFVEAMLASAERNRPVEIDELVNTEGAL